MLGTGNGDSSGSQARATGELLRWLGWRPLMLCCLAAATGVALADLLPHKVITVVIVVIVAIGSGVVAWKGRRAASAGLLVCALAAGASWAVARMTPSAIDICNFAPGRYSRLNACVVRQAGGGLICRAEEICPGGSQRNQVSGLFLLRGYGRRGIRAGTVLELEDVKLLRWRRKTNPYQRMPSLRWIRRRVWCVAWARRAKILEAGARPSRDWASAARERLSRALEKAMPGPDASKYATLVGAIVYGASLRELPEETVELYRRTGTIHVLVVSGSQVTLLVASVLLLTGGRKRPLRIYQVAIALPVAFAYATLCGREPSIMRAAALAAVLVAGMTAARRVDMATAVALVAAILVLAEPADIFSPGLQLTFAAFIGVVAAVRIISKTLAQAKRDSWLQRGADGLLVVMASTVGAWVMTLPILAYHFGGVALAGNLANAAVVPAAGLILLIGLPAALLAMINPLLAWGLLGICRALLDICLAVNAFCAHLPLAYLECVRAGPCFIVAWYAAAIAMYLLMLHSSGRLRVSAALMGAVALAALLTNAALPPRTKYTQVTWLDVGEGLCTVIETPSKEFIIFDAGSRDPFLHSWHAAEEVLLPYLRARGCKRIAALIISHADSDHYNAVDEILHELPVEAVVVSEYGQGKQYEKLLSALRATGAKIYRARRGARLRVGKDTVIQFLHPQRYRVEERSEDNNNCLVAMVCSAGQRVLLTADIEMAGQQVLMRALGKGALRAQMWQIPHHGRGSAYWEPFLEAVAAKAAIVPCGPEYLGGDMDERFVKYLAGRGLPALPTSQFGAVRVLLRPEGIQWSTYLHPAQ